MSMTNLNDLINNIKVYVKWLKNNRLYILNKGQTHGAGVRSLTRKTMLRSV